MKTELKQEIIDKAFSNISFAVIMGSFLFFLNLGYTNITTDVFLTDVKVLGLIVALIAIFVFERAYKLDDDELAIQGIEIFILSLIVLMLAFVLHASHLFLIVNNIAILAIGLYYIIKTIITCVKMKKC